MATNNQGNQGFVIPSAAPSAPSTPPGAAAPTETKGEVSIRIEPPTLRNTEPDASAQAYAIAGIVLLVWIVAAFFFRRKWAISFKEKRVSESNAEASGWAFFGALTSLGVGAVAAFFSKFATLVYLGPIVGVALLLFMLAFFLARK